MFARVALALAVAAVLTGCEEETPAKEEVVRAIKTLVLTDVAAEQVRKIAGVVEASTTSDLSFQVAGKVTEIHVDIGDSAPRGQIVAELDREPYELRVNTAKGELERARAQHADAEQKFKQQSQLFQEGFATKSAFDKAEADFKSAQSGIAVAESQLELARRDLRNTSLVAPFSGRIGEKYVEAFTEVSAGQKVIQLQQDSSLNVRVSLPETLLQRVSRNDMVAVRFPTRPDADLTGRITDIGSQAGVANAFPIKIALDGETAGLSPGMTAEVEFRFETDATGKAFLLPHSAILAGAEQGTVYVFVFDPDKGMVSRRTVTPVNIRGNEVEVVGDLNRGDILAAAGVSFLHDGMKVSRLAAAE